MSDVATTAAGQPLGTAASSRAEVTTTTRVQVRREAAPYASPYVAGVGIGVVLLLAFVLMGRGLGASGAFSSVVAAAVSTAAPSHAAGNEFLVPFGSLIESALATLFDFATRHAGTRHAQSLHEDIERAIRRQRPDAARRAALRLLADTDNVISQASAVPRRAAARQRKANA